MTAVAFTSLSFSQNRGSVPSVMRGGDGVVVATKETAAPNEAAKPVAQTHSDAAAFDNAQVSASSKAELDSQVRDLQVKMDKLNPALAFVVDQSSGRTLIQLTDRHTKEVIQQFPTAAAIQISKALDRFEKGRLINKTA
jgi:flagellar protein FlaG